MSALLEVRDLARSFGGIRAVDGVSLTVDGGEIVGIIGPNGSGKSTFFNLVAGVLPPDGGSVRFAGHEVTGWRPHRIARLGLGRTFQIPTPFLKMTVRQNLLVAGMAQPQGRSAKELARAAAHWLEFLRLAHLADEPAENLSGGQMKLLELGRVLMISPRLILLDEVAAGVNPVLAREIAGYIRTLNGQGITFLVIEHDMELIQDLCSRVIVMDRGQKIAEGDFDSVKANPQVIAAYLGSDEA